MKIVSSVLILVGLSILLLIFWPVIRVELKYTFDQISHVKYIIGGEQLNTFERPLTPVNTDFSIIIPKIDAVAPIIANVNPQNQTEYLQALRDGVAHAAGTALPGEGGNVYLFAHSTDAFYNVGKYNAVFYLLGKLSKGDEVFIYYQGEKIRYVVALVKVVKPTDIQYLAGDSDKNTLTLQTCYPPGTTIDRLVVIANQVDISEP
jgi:LPXTG-site transpeptidase (sortase) family protein